MIRLSRFLRQGYPYYYSQRHLPLGCLILFVLALGFIYLFEPFNVNFLEHKFSYFNISLLQTLLPSLILYIYFSMVNVSFRKTNPESRWTVGRELLHLSIVLLIMGLVNFLIRDLIYDNPMNWSAGYLFEEIRNLYLVGVLILALVVPLNTLRLQSKYRLGSQSMNQQLTHPAIVPQKPEPLFIITNTKGDDFWLNPQTLLFARAQGNYVEFIIKHGSQTQNLLKRITMKQLEDQLKAYPWMVKVHRGYLVNFTKIIKVTGNAQGYQIALYDFEEKVPVSRNHSSTLRKMIRDRAAISFNG